MDEERLSELEGWTLEDRKELTLSESVLLDAIAEVCAAVRDAWDSDQTSRREDRSLSSELEEDRRVMEGVDLELTLGGVNAAENAKLLLSERLAQLSEVLDAPTSPASPTSDDTMPAGEWSSASDET